MVYILAGDGSGTTMMTSLISKQHKYVMYIYKMHVNCKNNEYLDNENSKYLINSGICRKNMLKCLITFSKINFKNKNNCNSKINIVNWYDLI